MNRKYSALAGIAAPLLYVSLLTILGLLEPNYSHMNRMMSLLGGVGGIRGFIFNLGVAFTGLLIIWFAIGLHQSIHKGNRSKAGTVLLAAGGLGLIGSGIFHCNPNCANILLEPTLAGRAHILSAFIAGMCLSISPFFIFVRLKADSRWTNYRAFTLLSGILANIPGIFLWFSLLTTRVPEAEGLIQRLGLLFPLLWIEGMGLRMFRLTDLGK